MVDLLIAVLQGIFLLFSFALAVPVPAGSGRLLAAR
jgi:hypothetical protein